MKNEFVWTDETVREFIKWGSRHLRISDQDVIGMDIEAFKASMKPKPDWEILEGRHKCAPSHTWDPSQCPGAGCPIWSVRRLSDGEVFTVGERIRLRTELYSIRDFELLSPGRLLIIVKDGGSCGIEEISKAKLPLFTTNDGKEIFDGDDCWYVYSFSMAPMKWTAKLPFNKTGNFFSSEEAANEWILENKPCLSVQEIETILTTGNYGWISKIRKLASQKVGIFLLLTALLYGCKEKVAPIQYPQFLHNPCTGNWAVRTGTAEQYILHTDRTLIDTTYLGERGCNGAFTFIQFRIFQDSLNISSSADTVETATLGTEATFPDSLSAVSAWGRFYTRKTALALFTRRVDSTYRADQARKDSIYKCQHTYK